LVEGQPRPLVGAQEDTIAATAKNKKASAINFFIAKID